MEHHSTFLVSGVWLADAARDAVYALTVAVLALLLLAILVLVVLQVVTRIPWLRDRWPAKAVRRPTLRIEPLKDDALASDWGAAVAGLIRGRVTWRSDRFGLNAVSGQAGVTRALSGLGDVSREAKAAVAVLDVLTALLPRRRFVLSGVLQPAGTDGVGLSLELDREGGYEALITFWAHGFELDEVESMDVYRELAVASAAWVDIWMAKAIDGKDLLTADPQSWACFRLGLERQELGDVDGAGSLYELALAKDGHNVGALANLGILCRRAGKYEHAKEYLQQALDAVENPRELPRLAPEQNQDWYRLKFHMAALYANWATESEPVDPARMGQARDIARKLAVDALEMSAKIDQRRRGARGRLLQETLKPFLDGTIVPSVLVLVASATAAAPPAAETSAGTLATEDDVVRALKDDTVEPSALIAFVESSPHRPPAMLLNLACYYARSYDLITAGKRLVSAVRETPRSQRKGLIEVSRRDPALAPLWRKRPRIEDKLDAMLDPVARRDGANPAIDQFDLQDRVCERWTSEGWAVDWDGVDAPFTLEISHDGDRRLVEFAGTESLSDDQVRSAVGELTKFRNDHPTLAHVRALVVVPRDAEPPTADLADARRHGVDVERDTRDGLRPVAA
jgi:tetratricopeptide (TPR) repeat protein